MGKVIKTDELTVIIRTRNEERWIGHSIQSILDLINKPEIIVIDNNSTDKTLEIIRYFNQDPKLQNHKNKNYTKIKIFDISNYTPGKALNYGIRKAKHKNILIISAHCVLKKINLKKHFKDLKSHVCVFGNQNPIYMGKRITKRYIWSNFGDKQKLNLFSKSENRYFIHNALIFYNKNFLLKNPFDENLQGKEDRYWINDMIKKGKKSLYDPVLSADHHYTPNGNTWKGIG